MRVLGHVHTFNDEEVLERSLAALLHQTHPVAHVVLVDNHSTDGTLGRAFPPGLTVIRHAENLGTSGAVISGMRFALEHGYDWIWVFDADSAPRPDALARLMDAYRGLAPEAQARVQALASVAEPSAWSRPHHAMRFTRSGYTRVDVDPSRAITECDATIWSGSLFRVEAIRAIGLPSADYVLDWGEFAYGYQGTRLGYHTYLVGSSIFAHDTGARSPAWLSTHRVGPITFRLTVLPGMRLYYLIRNGLFFWLHEYERRNWRLYVRLLVESTWVPKYLVKLMLLRRWKEVRACLWGVWDGLSRNMARRYGE